MTQIGTKKSRKGCTNCKRRRVKCNEQAPCANCARRGEQCSLLGLSGSNCEMTFVNHNAHLGLPSTPEEWLQDLELMQHYNPDILTQPLGVRNDVQQVWRENIPREATKYPFLMHGILALSALHIAYKRPAEAGKYIPLCDKHQSKALEMFRTALCETITPEISTALFALSSTISILSIARSCADALAMPEPKYVGIEQVAELFALARGVPDLIHSCTHQWASSGPLAPLLDGDYTPHGGGFLPSQVQRQLLSLHQMLVQNCAPKYLPDCEKALRHLEAVYRHVAQSSRSSSVCPDHTTASSNDDESSVIQTSHIWRWTSLVPHEFVRMIAAGFPPALIILAHFAAVSLTARQFWYTHDWGRYVLTGVSMRLYGTEMHGYVDWALEQAGNGMAILSHTSEIDSVMNGNSPCPMYTDIMGGGGGGTGAEGWERPLSLEREIIGSDFGFIDF